MYICNINNNNNKQKQTKMKKITKGESTLMTIDYYVDDIKITLLDNGGVGNRSFISLLDGSIEVEYTMVFDNEEDENIDYYLQIVEHYADICLYGEEIKSSYIIKAKS